MENTEMIFLEILKAALQNRRRGDLCDLTQEQWQRIFSLAEAHKVLPLIYHAVFEIPGLPNADAIRMQVRKQMMIQVRKTDEFCRLNQKLKEAGCLPIVVKGLICRNLYPQPDLRISSDEDLLIDPSQFERSCQIFLEFGMETEASEAQMQTDYEVPFRKKDGVLFVELHKSLFPPESDAYGDWNRFFEDGRRHPIEHADVRTLSYTDHLFYLICHAFKHFVHSGFGIRQVCDIVMFANAYGKMVDWGRIYDNCCQIRGEVFAAAIFRIGEKYLTFDPEKAAYPDAFRNISVDETNMLMDLLDAGVYGGATKSRVHSSNMTLEAVSADRQGRKGRKSLLKTLFPPLKSLVHRYPYLQKYPVLLPIAWVCRLITYFRETKNADHNSAAESLKIGNQRVELLREYGIIL